MRTQMGRGVNAIKIRTCQLFSGLLSFVAGCRRMAKTVGVLCDRMRRLGPPVCVLLCATTIGHDGDGACVAAMDYKAGRLSLFLLAEKRRGSAKRKWWWWWRDGGLNAE
ncbi:hypothetical protein LIA77_00416 [Sarocladium implicatum]|nr:hypothetical protein LIA77_00416 [Sarocladium implicatum]